MSLAWVLLVIIVVYLYREKVKRILFYSNALYVVENFKDTEELNAYIEGHILLTPALGRTISIKINSSKIFYLITAINIERFFFVLFGHTTFIGLLIPPRQQYGNPDYHPFMFDHDPTFLSFTKYFYFERFQSLFPMNLLVHQRMIHWRTPDRGAFLRLLNNLERIGTTSRKRERTRRLALIPEQTFGCFKASQNFKEWTSRHDLLKDPENMISSIPDPFVRRKGKSCPGEAFVF